MCLFRGEAVALPLAKPQAMVFMTYLSWSTSPSSLSPSSGFGSFAFLIDLHVLDPFLGQTLARSFPWAYVTVACGRTPLGGQA